MKWGNVCNSDFRRRPNSLIHKEILQNKTKNSKKKKERKEKKVSKDMRRQFTEKEIQIVLKCEQMFNFTDCKSNVD